MSVPAAIVIGVFLFANLGIGVGLFVRRRARDSARESAASFFIANRGLGAIALFFTLAATNFSAFTVFGLSGAGFRTGYAYSPLMGLGTGLMALSFFLIGVPLRRIAARRGHLTQGDYIADRYGSRPLGKAYSAALIVLTIPYLSVQASSGGMMIEGVVGLPARWGALAVTLFILAYSLLGGMRSVVWTDVLQGALLFGLTVASAMLIARAGGGWTRLNEGLMSSSPEHYSLPGAGSGIGPLGLAGYYLLWFLADPAFPQLSQRFIAARNDSALKRSAAAYPAVCGILFFCSISIGLLCRAIDPGIANPDAAYPALLSRFFAPGLAAFLSLSGLAALMSTMDSQMLTLSSMAVRDFLPGRRQDGSTGRIALCVLSGVAYLLALRPPASIFDFLQRVSFNGYASLAPALIGGLYWKRANRAGAFASMASGLAASAAFGLGALRVPFPPVFAIAGVSTLGLVLGSLAREASRRRGGLAVEDRAGRNSDSCLAGADAPAQGGICAYASPRCLLMTVVVAALSFLPYFFKASGHSIFGVPWWVLFELALCLALSAVFALEARSGREGES